MAAEASSCGGVPFVYLDADALNSLIPHSVLIPHLRSSLPSLSPSLVSPPRLRFPLHSPAAASSASALLLMPAWSHHPSLPYIGLKAVTSFPCNSSLPVSLPGVHAAYLLFSSATGAPLAALDGTALTLLRTSAASALAATFLAGPHPRTLLLAGAGALAPHLVAAHRLARPSIDRVILWNRSPGKAADLAATLRELEPRDSLVVFEHAEDLDQVVGLADIVSCATSSETPLVRGELLKPGAHLDLVGSFTPAMAECDDGALARGRVFVDSEVALEEAGELVGALERGVMRPSDLAGTLVELASSSKVGRRCEDEVTVYKSVGTAVLDILAAQLAYETYTRGSGMRAAF